MQPIRVALLAVLLVAAAWPAARPQVRIRIQDYAEVPEKTRAGAFAAAANILNQAGVDPLWLDCSPSLVAMDPRCQPPPGALDLILRLFPERMANAAQRQLSCLGYAILPRDSFGTIATVFVDKARKEAHLSLAKLSIVLGHAIAHEAAHLLIGSAEHTREGLMQPGWTRSTLFRAMAKPMRLTTAEVGRIRRNVALRLRQSEPVSQIADGVADPLEPTLQARAR